MNLKQRILEKLRRISPSKMPLRECSGCGCSVGWRVIDGQFCFDSGCNCCGDGYSPEARDEEELDFYVNPIHGHVEKLEAWLKA